MEPAHQPDGADAALCGESELCGVVAPFAHHERPGDSWNPEYYLQDPIRDQLGSRNHKLDALAIAHQTFLVVYQPTPGRGIQSDPARAGGGQGSADQCILSRGMDRPVMRRSRRRGIYKRALEKSGC